MRPPCRVSAAALLCTLEKGLGNGVTPACRESWAAMYGIVASVMKKAA